MEENQRQNKFHASPGDSVTGAFRDSNKALGSPALRTRERIPKNLYASYEDQRSAAIDHYNNTAFVIYENGQPQLYINDGTGDLTDCVKVVCSTKGANSPKGDEISRARFDRAMDDEKNFVEWSVFQDCIENKVKAGKGFANITPTVKDIQEGDYEAAIEKLSIINLDDKKNTLIEKVRDLQEGQNLDPQTEAYTKAIATANNLQITKNKNKKRTTYKISLKHSSDNAMDVIQAELSKWAMFNTAEFKELLSRDIQSILKKTLKNNKTSGKG